MDKSWIKLPRNTQTYLVGLNSFLDFAFQHGASASTIICPCSKCGFRKWRTQQEVYDHLVCKLFSSRLHILVSSRGDNVRGACIGEWK